MGSGSSRLGSSPPSSSSPPQRSNSNNNNNNKVNRTKQRLASFICGASSSSSSSSSSSRNQTEDCAAESPVGSVEYCQQVADKLPITTNESILISNEGSEFTSRSSPRSEPGASSESSTTSSEHVFIERESSSKRKWFSESDEVVPSPPSNGESKCYQQTMDDSVSAPCTGQIRPVSVNPNRLAGNDVDDLVNIDMPQTSQEAISPISSSVQHEDIEQLPTILDEINQTMGSHNSYSGPVPVAPECAIDSQSNANESSPEVVPPGLGLFVSDRVQARPDGSVLHVDVVSISSNILPNSNNEISTREARRNNRRMFWDAFSSRSSRRQADFPAILFTTEDADLMGSRRRWLLDIGDDFFDDGVGGDSWHFGRRSRATSERRRNSRSEFWDRLRGSASESSHRSSCPFDLHPDGSCSCELDEETSALTSISRIVLLAEALFEVLDEIHRQPDSFSLSMLSVPAPESVVDSLPLKIYEKPNRADCEDEKLNTANHGDEKPNAADSNDDVDQCYICLVEYEEGDKIRVLPCHHVYHMSCVDKWLKEVHGICPLCRGDVRGGVREGTASSSNADLT